MAGTRVAKKHPRRPVTVPGPPVPAQVEIGVDEHRRGVVLITTDDGQRLTMDAREFMRIAEQVVRSLAELSSI